MPLNAVFDSEIKEQPSVLAGLLKNPDIEQAAEAIRAADPHYIIIAARGSSDNAARYAQYLFGIHFGCPVVLAAPSINTLYGATPRYRDGLVIAISQSGRAPDVTQVVADAAAQGTPTIAITNNPGSPLASTAKYHIALNAGEEKSMAATKSHTGQLMTLAALTAHVVDNQPMKNDLMQIPELASAALSLQPLITQRAERFRFMTRCVTLGRGYSYTTSHEIAFKLKELTYVAAEAHSSANFRHGPKAVIEPNFPAIVIAPSGAVYPDMLALIKELHDAEADLTVISQEDEALSYANLPLQLPHTIPEWLAPIVAVIPGQILAMAVAAVKGHHIDAPRGLNKVTMTR